jgi:phosphatidate cytidylyltransferase
MTSNVSAMFAVIFGLLILATLITFALRRARPDQDFSDLSARIKTWWVIVALFFAALSAPVGYGVSFFGIISYLALKEYFSLIPTRQVDRRAIFWAYVSIPLQYYWIATGWYGMFIIFIPVYMFLLIPMRVMLMGETKGYLHSVGTIHWGLMTTVFCVSHLAFLLKLPPDVNPAGGGAGLVLFAVFTSQFNDVAQFCWGKALGKHKVIPSVSPKKTVEGLIGGIVTSVTLGAILAPHLTPLSHSSGAVAAFIISLGGFVGDVTISALKRDLGIKDSGHMLPGHGGILDRIDSLYFTAPLFFHYLRYLKY